MKKFNLEVLNYTHSPQGLVYSAMKQCHSAKPVGALHDNTEKESGNLIVKYLLSGKKGHFGCFEHPSITMAVQNFPHSVMQQLRTHRVCVSFDFQSFRHTCEQFQDVLSGKLPIESAIYLRPVGTYKSPGKPDYEYTPEARCVDLMVAFELLKLYCLRISEGMSVEQARSLAPFDYRQHFVMSCNARSLMHLLDLRHKKDAQLECQIFAETLLFVFSQWMPEVALWYSENRMGKALLSP